MFISHYKIKSTLKFPINMLKLLQLLLKYYLIKISRDVYIVVFIHFKL